LHFDDIPDADTLQDRQEYMQRLQVLFAYLFYRWSNFPDGLVQNILAIVRPPSLRASSVELKEVQETLQCLFSTILRGHMRLTTYFLQHTDYGREYYETIEKRRRSKLKLPELDVEKMVEVLNLPAAVVRALWYPLAVVVPSSLWEPNRRADGEEWEFQADADTPTLSIFRTLSADIVSKTSRVWSATQHELSAHIQIAVLKDLSAPLLSCKWPPL
jgi:hypothetical protein